VGCGLATGPVEEIYWAKISSTKLQSQAHEFLSQRSLALPQLEFHLVNSSHNRNNLSDT